MGRIQYEELACPFCDKGRIGCLFFAGAWQEKRTGRNALGSGKSVTKSSDVWIVQSGCSVCGKSQEEVEKRLKQEGII